MAHERILMRYGTLVFDCDGVIMDSNRVKSEAFHRIAQPWGERAASVLLEYHRAHGGISRHVKLRHFLEHIAQAPSDDEHLDILLQRYAKAVRNGLLTCAIAPGLGALRARTADARWMVVSGGLETELRSVFAERNIAHLFDGGIFGSPADKDMILTRERAHGNLTMPAVFLGDSRYDHDAARRAGLDFVFVSGWTEMEDWRAFVADYRLRAIDNIAQLEQ
ncbi:HAD hydrolase-like protein [Croceicoccus sp. F390]|uniref:phosphoglycolate phosphatase n=1 Tax=Croceicoccus esteveae TaxID=3075597 RepID=A0ABU2ZGL3_9SPHN|nr:HAD family hydrolase [Croceicoccus sp. F390]MDT0575728.1 HAD hydrolase-like protein [Croceicoccus sp. F390]